jgi:precorrin-6A synthase
MYIWWGAYLGMPDEILISGELAKVAPKIIGARQEARDRHGWIMDSYILKRDRSRP